MSVDELKQVAISKIESIDNEKALQEIIAHLNTIETNTASPLSNTALDDFFQQMTLRYGRTLSKLAK